LDQRGRLSGRVGAPDARSLHDWGGLRSLDPPLTPVFGRRHLLGHC
jgi:hypothetical protein